jgi:hypothetical protein
VSAEAGKIAPMRCVTALSSHGTERRSIVPRMAATKMTP